MEEAKLKKLKKLALLEQEPSLAIFDELEDIQEKLEPLKEALSGIEFIKGEKGEDGLDGVDGKDGYTPVKGVDYFDGKDGRDGKDGLNGKDGKDGKDGLDGLDGQDGKDGEKGEKGDKPDHKWDGTKLMFEKPNGEWGKAVDLIGKDGKGGILNWGVVGSNFKIKNNGVLVSEDTTTRLNFTGSGIDAITNDGNGQVTIQINDNQDLSPYLKKDQTTPQVTVGRFTFPALTVDTNTLYVDSVNHRVGIGTTNPFTKLEISNTGAGVTEGLSISNYTTPAANIGSELSFYGGTGQRISSIFGAWSGAATTDGYLAFRTRNANVLTEQMRINNSGNVGIGTTSPTYKLDVKGITATSAVRSDIGFDIYGVPAPTAPTAVTSAGGSVDTGTHSYAVIYTTALGQSNGGAWLQNYNVTGGNTVTLTIPVSTDPRVTGRKIFRTKVGVGGGGATEYLLATINNNTDTTYVDTTADADLTGAVGQHYRAFNTTTNYITVGGTRAMVLDTNFTSFGYLAGSSQTLASENTFYGSSAGRAVTTGSQNTYVGAFAGLSNVTAGNNTAFGYAALYLGTGADNTAIGSLALVGMTTGSSNVALGRQSGRKIADGTTDNTTGTLSVFIGTDTKALGNGQTNQIVIGSSAIGAGSNSVVLGNTSITKTILNGSVGLGTTAPTNKLDVRGTASTDGIRSAIGFDIYPVPNPTTLSGVAIAGSGLEIGDYYYLITYTTALGETNSFLANKITTTAGNQSVTLTIPVSTDPRVTGRKIYRSKVNTAGYLDYVLTTVANNTDTTYTDTTPDASLTGSSGASYFRMNTTSNQITVGGVKSMAIDTNNTAFGYLSLSSITTGGRNTVFGYGAGRFITTGNSMAYFGDRAGWNTTTGAHNVAINYQALFSNTTGSYNIGIGTNSLLNNANGSNDIAIGFYTLAGVSGNNHSNNVSVGNYSGYLITTGQYNTFLAHQAGYNITTGSYNLYSGYNAGRFIADGTTANQTSSFGVYLGTETKASANGVDNEIVIGYNAIGRGSNTVTIGNTSILANYFSGQLIPGKISSAPTAIEGGIYFNSTDKHFYGYNGTDWKQLDN